MEHHAVNGMPAMSRHDTTDRAVRFDGNLSALDLLASHHDPEMLTASSPLEVVAHTRVDGTPTYAFLVA